MQTKKLTSIYVCLIANLFMEGLLNYTKKEKDKREREISKEEVVYSKGR